ncbi:MAG: histidine--tRNA ligase [Nanoarchaeota archaeon]
MQIETAKGFRDIFSPASLKREKIKRIIEDKFKLFGFLPLETPSIEYDDLLKGDNEQDEAVSDRFKLKDKGGRNLGLRFEFTVQLSRIFKENPNIKLPFRRYQIGNVFRDEPLRPDRYREFIQCDADILGDSSIKSDAECLALADSILSELKIKAEILVNNRKLLNSILEKSEIKKEQQQVLREIDKLDKLPKEEVEKNLAKVISKNQIKRLFDFLSKDLNYFLENKFNGAEEIKELEELGKIYKYKIKFMPTLMRGFSYYTGNVWEIWSKEKKASLASGGRFDDKVGKYANKQIPAVGISFGTLVDYENIEVDTVDYLLISLNQDKKTIELAQKLRKNKKSAMIFYGKISKALEYANSCKIRKVLILGEQEIKQGKIKERDMISGKEKLIEFS